MSRPFDPVLSAALRNELAALADRATPDRRTAALRRPQVWITVVTALVLVVATIGVLRLTTHPDPAATGRAVVDPLQSITDPASGAYVARAVHVVLDASGTGSGSRAFTVPPGMDAVQTYLVCSRSGAWKLQIHRALSVSAKCGPGVTSNDSFAIDPGTYTAQVTVGRGVPWSLLVIERPAPTLTKGALIDPAAAVRDPFDPDSIVDARLLSAADPVPLRGDGSIDVTLPAGVGRVRLYLVCTTPSAPSSPTTRATVDGRPLVGCQNSIAHWYDFTPRARVVHVVVQAPTTTEYTVLLVRAPAGARDSAASSTLPFPGVEGAVLAQARGSGAAISGSYTQPHDFIGITTTCRGTGWLEIVTGGSSTTTRGTACSTAHPATTGFGGDGDRGRHGFTVIPHGDISWTMQLTDAGDS